MKNQNTKNKNKNLFKFFGVFSLGFVVFVAPTIISCSNSKTISVYSSNIEKGYWHSFEIEFENFIPEDYTERRLQEKLRYISLGAENYYKPYRAYNYGLETRFSSKTKYTLEQLIDSLYIHHFNYNSKNFGNSQEAWDFKEKITLNSDFNIKKEYIKKNFRKIPTNKKFEFGTDTLLYSTIEEFDKVLSIFPTIQKGKKVKKRFRFSSGGPSPMIQWQGTSRDEINKYFINKNTSTFRTVPTSWKKGEDPNN